MIISYRHPGTKECFDFSKHSFNYIVDYNRWIRETSDRGLKDSQMLAIRGHSGAINTSDWNMEQLVPRHFDHVNSLIFTYHFIRQLQKSVLYTLQNRLVRHSRISNEVDSMP